MSGRENGEILAGMALGWADITNATVPMLDVVPVHEADCPGPGVVELGKAVSRKLRAVFGRPKQRFRVSIVITDSGSRIRGPDSQPVEHRQHRRGLERRAVVAVQNRLGRECGNPLGERRTAHQMRGMVGVIAAVHLPADNLAAIQVEDEIKVKGETSAP